MVILIHLRNFASVEVFNKALLTYLFYSILLTGRKIRKNALYAFLLHCRHVDIIDAQCIPDFGLQSSANKIFYTSIHRYGMVNVFARVACTEFLQGGAKSETTSFDCSHLQNAAIDFWHALTIINK